jgi:hypothetical protein
MMSNGRNREFGGMSSGMNRVVPWVAVLGATVFLMLRAAAAQELPAGPDREVVSRECQACHDLSMVVGATGLTRDGWNGVIEEMASYGMSVSPDQRTRILEYLSIYLGPSSPPSKASQ